MTQKVKLLRLLTRFTKCIKHFYIQCFELFQFFRLILQFSRIEPKNWLSFHYFNYHYQVLTMHSSNWNFFHEFFSTRKNAATNSNADSTHLHCFPSSIPYVLLLLNKLLSCVKLPSFEKSIYNPGSLPSLSMHKIIS